MALPARWIGSPNRTKGRKGFRPEAVVVHIMEGTLAGTDSWFRNASSDVSAHYGVGLNGDVHQYVGESDTAWHAGRVWGSTWSGRRAGVNPNLYTIGIEHEGDADSDWPTIMRAASAALISDICNRWAIPIDRDHVVGHREIYARKTCPGHRVDLEELIALARQEATNPARYNLVERAGTVTTVVNLNIRASAPSTVAKVRRVAPAGTSIDVVGFVSNGQSVNGNAHWYRTVEGDFFWAGGTSEPVPAL
jgi:N-acetyl-anhydromuramyl-L-alanine amidase AmpD